MWEVIASFKRVKGFDEFPQKKATEIIYKKLIPKLESQNVYLSNYGNHNDPRSLQSIGDYKKRRDDYKLFDIARVQRAFLSVAFYLEPSRKWDSGSYGLKHYIERQTDEYLTNGDLIVAMLLSGYKAKFYGVNCEFKVK